MGRGFFLGSAVVAFVQGAAVGAMIRGVPVVNGQYAGGRFEWLRPLPVLTGIGLVFGYALLGAGWLVLKSEGGLRDWACGEIPVLVVVVVRSWRWRGWPRLWSAMARWTHDARPFLGPGLSGGRRSWRSCLCSASRRRSRRLAVRLTVAVLLAAFATLAALFWPYMIPYSVTVASAAAPESSLSFLFWGAGLFVLPMVAIYTVVVYWVFRGKMRGG